MEQIDPRLLTQEEKDQINIEKLNKREYDMLKGAFIEVRDIVFPAPDGVMYASGMSIWEMLTASETKRHLFLDPKDQFVYLYEIKDGKRKRLSGYNVRYIKIIHY